MSLWVDFTSFIGLVVREEIPFGAPNLSYCFSDLSNCFFVVENVRHASSRYASWEKKVMARCVEAWYGHVDRMIQRWTYFQYYLDPVRTCLPYIQSRMLHIELNEAPEWCIHRPVPASVSRTALKIMHGCLAGWRWCSKTTLTPHLCPPLQPAVPRRQGCTQCT